MNDKIEAEINQRLWGRTIPYIRVAMLAAALLFLLFWAWDKRVDPTGSEGTAIARISAGCFYLILYALVTFSRAGRRWIKPIYIAAALMAQVFLLWIFLQIRHGYVLGYGSFLAVVMAVIVVGPRLRISIPLVLCALALPNVVAFASIALGYEFPGLPNRGTAVDLLSIHLGVAVIAVVLILVNTRLSRRMLADNVQLEQLAATDPLTAVQNRRQLELDFKREKARQGRHGRPVAVLELDVDHFKQVNDAHGHAVGDEVLRHLTELWRSLIREVDVLARVGGEEFVVLLPETDAGGAWHSAERLRARTASRAIATSAGDVHLTVSVGITLAVASDADLAAVLQRVDRALYRAKHNGRNRCEYVDPRRTEEAAALSAV